MFWFPQCQHFSHEDQILQFNIISFPEKYAESALEIAFLCTASVGRSLIPKLTWACLRAAFLFAGYVQPKKTQLKSAKIMWFFRDFH